jgi:hypothetical protein
MESKMETGIWKVETEDGKEEKFYSPASAVVRAYQTGSKLKPVEVGDVSSSDTVLALAFSEPRGSQANLLIEGLGPDGVPHWGAKSDKWVRELSALIISDRYEELGRMLAHQVRRYIEDVE